MNELEERSHRPHRSPNQLDASVAAQVVEWRRLHPSWGPVRLCDELRRKGIAPPSHMAAYRALVRSGLVVPNTPRKRLKTYKRWERGRPMELWQLDVVGGVLTDDGTEAKLLTGIDDHSRFVVCCGVMARATLRPVCLHFAAALERHGVPEEILTDNGKVFTNRYGHTDSETLFDRLCRENGITHLLTAPRSPTTNGKTTSGPTPGPTAQKLPADAPLTSGSTSTTIIGTTPPSTGRPRAASTTCLATTPRAGRRRRRCLPAACS